MAAMGDILDDAVLEQALQAQVIRRCRRALLHEVRNGLQPMHAGLEALNRITTMTPFPLDKAQRYLQLVRQASSSQEQALERAVERIAPENTDPQTVDAIALVREVTRFLNSDAAVAGVRLQVDLPPTMYVHARPHHLRLILLACTLDAIDCANGDGQLIITAQPIGEHSLVQLADTRAVASDFDAANAGSSPAQSGLHLYVAKRMLAQVRGELDCVAGQGGGFTIAISLLSAPAPSSAT